MELNTYDCGGLEDTLDILFSLVTVVGDDDVQSQGSDLDLVLSNLDTTQKRTTQSPKGRLQTDSPTSS